MEYKIGSQAFLSVQQAQKIRLFKQSILLQREHKNGVYKVLKSFSKIIQTVVNKLIHFFFYSHSIVAGGLLEISSTTLLTSLTLLIISDEINSINSNGSLAAFAVIKSVEFTMRIAMTQS